MLTSSNSFSKEKINSHLKDINSTISEEDIKNIGFPESAEHRIIINKGIIEIARLQNVNPPDLSNAMKTVERKVFCIIEYYKLIFFSQSTANSLFSLYSKN